MKDQSRTQPEPKPADGKNDSKVSSEEKKLADIIERIGEEDPAVIADIIKKWLEENKKF